MSSKSPPSYLVWVCELDYFFSNSAKKPELSSSEPKSALRKGESEGTELELALALVNPSLLAEVSTGIWTTITQRHRHNGSDFPLIRFSHQLCSTLASPLHTSGTTGRGEKDTHLKRTQLESQPAPRTLGPRTSPLHLSRAHSETRQIISIPKGALSNTKRRNLQNLHGKGRGCL